MKMLALAVCEFHQNNLDLPENTLPIEYVNFIKVIWHIFISILWFGFLSIKWIVDFTIGFFKGFREVD